MNNKREKAIKATLFGFGFALALAGFCMIIASACEFTWPGMIGSFLAFGMGLTMILIGGYMEDDG